MRGLSARSIFANAARSSSASGQPDRLSTTRAAEIERGDVGDRQPVLHGAKRLRVEPPPLGLVFLAFVVDREAGFLQRLQIAADGARRDLDLFGELVNRDAGAPRLDFAQDLPLPDDFRVSHDVDIALPWGAPFCPE